LIDKFKNFIFDFDGTLVNSNRFHSLAFRKALYKKKRYLKKFNYENLKGLKTDDAFKKLGIKNNVKDLSKLKKEYFRKNLNKIKLYKNCKKTLNYLLNKKKKIFIVSGASKKNITQILRRKNIKINGIISGEDCKFSKPHALPYKKCLVKFKLKNNESIAIEDAVSGIKSAKKNGLICIGINNYKIKNFADFYFNNFSILISKFLKK
jgi:HAD superfamily hydrolase (TIGR01509 family)